MKKRLLSLFLTFILIQTMLPTLFVVTAEATDGITEAEVIERLLSAETKWKNGSVYDDSNALCKTCFGFCRELFYYVFNVSLPTLVSRENASLAGTKYMDNIIEIKHLGTGYSLDDLKALLLMAKPGDVLIASSSSSNHFVMVRSVLSDGSGIYVYDANWDRNNGIRTNALWTAEAMRRSRPIGVTLYRYTNYITTNEIPTSANTYTVNFDPNGGSVSQTSKKVTAGGVIGDLPTPTRAGYSFLGWSTAKGSGGMIATADNLIVDQDMTLYALWKNSYSVIAEGVYTLTPQCAPGMRLDVKSGSTDSGANIQIYTANGTAAQQFEFTYLADGYYKITAKVSGKVLDIQSGKTASGTNVQQYNSNGTNAQQWMLMDAGGGYYTIIPRLNTELCLDVSDAGTSNGTNVQVWTQNSTNAQKWKLTAVEPTVTITFDAKGGSVSQQTKTVTNGSTFGDLPTPVRQGYEFNGWWYDNDVAGTCVRVTSSTTVNLTSNTTLYAVWTKVSDTSNPSSGSTSTTASSNQSWGAWSSWSTTKVTASATRQVETRVVKVSDSYTEYRYGRYVDSTGTHDCWCAKYLEGLSYVSGSASLQYSPWSTTRYSSNGKSWTCGYCSGNHIGVDHTSADGRSWWAEYKLPSGSYYWEESRTVSAVYETQYRYRDLLP